jgi:hypothetical protein
VWGTDGNGGRVFGCGQVSQQRLGQLAFFVGVELLELIV